MEVVAQVRAMEGETSVSNKRRRIDSGDPRLLHSSLSSSLSNDRRSNHCHFSVSDSPEYSTSPAKTPEVADPSPATLLCLCNKSDIISPRSPDLKADENCGTEKISISNRNGFSDEKTVKVMESPSTKKKKTVPARSIPVAKMPSAAEIEEFFSVAEKYEEKRFAEKYNYDIVKDVPLEGRYQWVSLKSST